MFALWLHVTVIFFLNIQLFNGMPDSQMQLQLKKNQCKIRKHQNSDEFIRTLHVDAFDNFCTVWIDAVIFLVNIDEITPHCAY